MATPGRMHQTTVRFGPDLWEALDRECALLGVSIAQYVREAALTRLVYAAGRRGDEDFEAALDAATGSEPPAGAGDSPGIRDPLDEAARTAPPSAPALERARIELADSSALWAEGDQTRRRARELRAQVLQFRQERERKSGRRR
jgi:hypothetical protein